MCMTGRRVLVAATNYFGEGRAGRAAVALHRMCVRGNGPDCDSSPVSRTAGRRGARARMN